MKICDSGHLQNERERLEMERKYIDTDKAHWKDPEFTTVMSEVDSGTNIQSKLAFCTIKRNRRLDLSPSAGVATGLQPMHWTVN